MPDHGAICLATVSLATFDSAYVLVGTGQWSSSAGAAWHFPSSWEFKDRLPANYP